MKNKIHSCIALIVVISTLTLCIGWGEKTQTTSDYLQIAAFGGSITLNASGYSVTNLMQIAALCNNNGGRLHLKNCGVFNRTDLMKICIAGGGGNGNREGSSVTFEF